MIIPFGFYYLVGVLVVSVAVGEDLDWANLQEVSSDPAYVFNVTDYTQLKTIIANVVNISCSGKRLNTSNTH